MGRCVVGRFARGKFLNLTALGLRPWGAVGSDCFFFLYAKPNYIRVWTSAQKHWNDEMMDIAWKFQPPIEFDRELYRSSYPDLADLDDQQLREHYFKFGSHEGRTATPFAARASFLKVAEGAPSILEIGPGHKPAFRGDGVKYFDVLDEEELRDRALNVANESADGCVDKVHFVRKDGDLSTVNETFSIVFSSHNIEHQTNLIKHLNDVHNLIHPGGAFIGIMPDRRYCFDRNIPGASVGDVFEAYFKNNVTHKIADIIDQYAMPMHNDSIHHWTSETEPEYDVNIDLLRRGIEEAMKKEYVDVHAWRFSFAEFKVVMDACIKLDYVKFKNLLVFPTPYLSNEFCFAFYD